MSCDRLTFVSFTYLVNSADLLEIILILSITTILPSEYTLLTVAYNFSK